MAGGNLSRQVQGRQASMIATEWVMSPFARFSGERRGSAGESHEPSMNWIDSFGSVRVSIAHTRGYATLYAHLDDEKFKPAVKAGDREAVRALLLDALLAPGGVAAALCDALDAAGPYGAGWPAPRVAAGPARLLKTAIVGNDHVRGLACGDDGKSFKWIAFRSAATELGQALLASPGDVKWWLAGTIKRDEYNGGNAAEMHLEDAAVA